MHREATVAEHPRSTLSQTGAEAGELGPGPTEIKRLIFLGEALRAASEFGGMDKELLDQSSGVLECLIGTYETITSTGKEYSKEDFALYFLSSVHDLLDGEQGRQALRIGAVSYLKENKEWLSPDFAALDDEALYEVNSRAEELGLNPCEGVASVRSSNLHPKGAQAPAPIQKDFAKAPESLAQDPSSSINAPRHAIGIQSTNSRGYRRSSRGISNELERLQVRRLGIVKELRSSERRRLARAVSAICIFGSASLLALAALLGS